MERNGYIVYAPETEGAHAFDRLCVSRDKKTVFIAEVKTKPRRKFYPDTGIDIRHYQEYKFIQDKYKLDVFIFFVDEVEKRIYGNSLEMLTKTMRIQGNDYPLERGGIIYFPLALMETVATLTDEQSKDIAALSSRSYVY